MQAARNRRKSKWGEGSAKTGTAGNTGSAGVRGREGSKLTAAAVLRESAARWHVPLWVLVAVKLLETGDSEGTGETSSAGALGPFQFEPSTAATYGVKNTDNFVEAADGAAHYLHDLHAQAGSWSGALEGYNGGPEAIGKGYAYNERDAKAKLKEFGLTKAALDREEKALGRNVNVGLFEEFKGGLDKAFGWSLGGLAGGATTTEGLEQKDPGKILGGAITNPLSSIADLVAALLDVHTWIRIGEVTAGAALVYLALKTLTGQGVSDLPGATAAKTAVKLA